MANPTKRYRLTVPEEDISVQRFLDCQGNYSVSIRMLIREYIAKHGYTDVTCQDVDIMPKRGRPSNVELEFRRSQVREFDEDLGGEQVPQMPAEPVRKPIAKKHPVAQPAAEDAVEPAAAAHKQVPMTSAVVAATTAAAPVEEPEESTAVESSNDMLSSILNM